MLQKKLIEKGQPKFYNKNSQSNKRKNHRWRNGEFPAKPLLNK